MSNNHPEDGCSCGAIKTSPERKIVKAALNVVYAGTYVQSGIDPVKAMRDLYDAVSRYQATQTGATQINKGN